jgi:two-component system, cell cycle sensor histidine kinase and response regulator CckA
MAAWRVALPYLVIGFLWIALSDWLLARLLPAGVGPGQTVKGLVFVAVTAALIYALTTRELREKRNAAEERLRLERRLAATQRFEAMGQLTSGVAHDFNNILTAISGNLAAYIDRSSPASPAPELSEAQRAARRGAELTRQLLAVGRGQVMTPEPLDLNEVIRDMDGLLGRLLGAGVRIETHLAPDLAPIQADRGFLEQVLMNLAINARDAMPDGGTLTLRTANEVVDAARARSFPFPFQPGDYVRLEVIDTGVGMDAKLQARIFEPFFTTKPKDVGTGLGLATVYGIVKQSGGYISVRSAPGAGAAFTVHLPRIAGRSPADPPVAPEGGSGTILVVDDDPAVRSFVTRTLEREGFAVLSAGGATEALRRLEETREGIDLLVTDSVMPGMTGMQLIETARSAGARMSVLLISGNPDQESASAVPCLPKPFTAAELGRRVRELLDQP